MRPLLGALGASFCAGAALMVTLVDVQLVAQTLLGKDSFGGTLLLARFLIALPVGAVLGGVLVARLGERWVTVAGLLLAAVGYVLIAGWPLDVLGRALRRASCPAWTPTWPSPALGLGLVIAPLAARGAAGHAAGPARRGLGRRGAWPA